MYQRWPHSDGIRSPGSEHFELREFERDLFQSSAGEFDDEFISSHAAADDSFTKKRVHHFSAQTKLPAFFVALRRLFPVVWVIRNLGEIVGSGTLFSGIEMIFPGTEGLTLFGDNYPGFLVAILPPVILAVCTQRWIVRGLTLGAVKG